jgi:hypothetical protein
MLAREIASAPRAAVIEAWQEVEREVGRLARRAGLDPADEGRRLPWATHDLVEELRKRGVVEEPLAQVVRELQEGRNVAAHSGPYPVERRQVVDYVKLAGRVRDALRLTQRRSEGAES